MEVHGGALRDSFEHHMTVPDLTAPVVQRERMDTAHAAAFTKDIAVFFDLQQERPAYLVFSVFSFQVFHEEDASFMIELNFAIDKIGSGHLNRLASGFLRDHVDGLLRKRVPEQRSLTAPSTDDNVERFAPATPILLLFVLPFPI